MLPSADRVACVNVPLERTCTASALGLGQRCATHAECASGVCHPQSGYRCVANRNGRPGDFCTDHAQCSPGSYCNVPPGKTDGTCAVR